jgi:RHS repeat-associated protein
MGSAMLELDGDGLVISYEEYHSYGTTAFHSVRSGVEVSARRYRYIRRERDEETGLYYMSARYYASWLGRWASADPAGLVDGPGLFTYAKDNPVRFVDPNGTDSKEPQEIRVRELPKGAPKGLQRWAYSDRGGGLTTDPKEFAARAIGPVFVYDPNAPEANTAELRKADALARARQLGSTAAVGARGESSESFEEAVAKVEARIAARKANQTTQQLALLAGILNLELGEDLSAREGTNPHGIVGGENRGGSSSPTIQGIISVLQIAGVFVSGRFIKKILQGKTAALTFKPIPTTTKAQGWWPRISAVAPDWAQKGAHIHIEGIELAVRPGRDGDIVFKSVFSSQNQKQVESAINIAEQALEDPGFRQRLYNAAGRAVVLMKNEARAAELRQLMHSLSKRGL